MHQNIFSADCDLREHVRHTIELLTGGTLLAEFRKDPLGTITCLYLAIGFILQQVSKHGHDEGNVVGADPLAIELATALEAPPVAGGPLSDALLSFVLAQLWKRLQELLDDYLDGLDK